MKIALLGSYNLADGYKGAYNALVELGHEVVFEPLARIFAERKGNEFDNWLSGFFQNFDGDFVILWRGENLNAKHSHIIETNKKCPILYYSWDDPFQITEASYIKTIEIMGCVDIIGTCCKKSMGIYRNGLKKNAFHVLPGFAPDVHKIPQGLTVEEIEKYTCDISFVATNCYKDKFITKYPHFDRVKIVEKIIEALPDKKINLWGAGQEGFGWTNEKFGGGQKFELYYKGWLPFEETHKCFYLSKINLNSHIRPDGVEYFNERTFQVLGSGGFLLTDHVCKAQDVFAIDKEISTYSNYDELAAKVKYYLDNDEMRKKIAENGHARSIKDFSWRSWAEKIIREMRQLKNV